MKTSGADYLRWLLSFSTKNEKELLDGTTKLTLNPSCIRYINSILNNLGKISSIDPEAAKKIKYDDLVDLRYSLGTVKSIILESSSNHVDRFPDVDLSLFSSIQILEISKVKPDGILNFFDISLRIIKLSAHHTLNSLAELLDVSMPNGNKGNKPWSNLLFLDCSHNNIPEIDNTMLELINVEEVDLSYNIITRVNFLENCCKLHKVDLSFNQLTSVINLHLILGNIKVLILSNNKLKSSEGLEKLYGLESLDLSWNMIAYEEDISRLKSLPLLCSLSMKGNPVSLKKTYRVYVFSHLTQNVVLDGEPMNKSEAKKVKEISKKEFQENVNMTLTVSSVGSSGAMSMSSLASTPNVTTSLSPTNSYLATFEPLSPSSMSYTNPIVSSSKNRQHRVAKILESNSANSSPKNSMKPSLNTSFSLQSPKNEASSLSEDFLEKLRQEYGEQWLVIFNELIRDNEQAKHQEQQRTKDSKKSNKHLDILQQSPPALDDEDESIISKAAKMLLESENTTESHVNTNNSSASVSISESVNQVPKQQTKPESTPMPEIQQHNIIDNAIAAPQNSTKGRPNEDQILVEDFYVQQRSPSGSSEERILEFKLHSNILSYGKHSSKGNSTATPAEPIIMHKDDTVSELDVYTAMSVVTIPLSCLVRVELVKTSADKPQISNPTMSALSLGLAQQAAEKPGVEFEFRRDYVDRTEHEVLLYQLEDITAQSKLFSLVEPIVKFNTRDNYVRCMNCNDVKPLKYDQPKPDNCSQCQSPYIIILDENQYESFLAEISIQQNSNNNESNTVSEDEEEDSDNDIDLNLQKQPIIVSSFSNDSAIQHPTPPKQTSTINDQEEFNILDDTNMQVYLRLSFMQKDKAISMIGENILSILVCSFNFFGKSSDDEKLCYLALTNMNLYIIIQHKKPTEKDPGLTLHSQHQLSDIKAIWVGLLYQNFRLDITDNGKDLTTYLFITREQRKTQQFVDTLFDTMTNSLDEGCQMRFLNRQYLQSMSRLLGNLQPNFQENFQLFTMLFQNVKLSKWKPFDLNQLKMFQGGLKAFQGQLTITSGSVNIVPRSLIVTNEKLILCDEDYCHFPSTEDLTKNNQHFVVKSEHNISDLIQIELASSVTENCVRFKFETENEASSISPPGSKSQPNSGQLWELITCSTASKNLIVETVSRKWKDLFKIDLSILQN